MCWFKVGHAVHSRMLLSRPSLTHCCLSVLSNQSPFWTGHPNNNLCQIKRRLKFPNFSEKKWTLITFWTVKMCFIWGEAQLKRNYCSPVPTESREVFVITPQEHCNFFFFQGRDSEIRLTYVQKDTGWVSLLPPRSTTPTNEMRGKLLKMFPERVHSDEIKAITNARIH